MSEVDFDTLFQDYTKKLDMLNTKFYVAWDKLKKKTVNAQSANGNF